MRASFVSKSKEQTRALGEALAQKLFPGSVVLLEGDLGAGKTTLVGGVAKGLGVEGDVISPTFNIMKCYFRGKMPLYHIDAYRLEGQNIELGLEENIEGDGACFIEWPQFIMPLRPFNDDTINYYKNLPKKNGSQFKRTATMSNSVGLKLVVSPTIKSKFGPAAQVTLKEGGQYSKFKSNSSNLIKLKFGGNSSNHLKAFGNGLKRVKTVILKKIKTIVDEQDEEYEDDSSSKKKNQNISKDKSNFDEDENEEESIDKKNIKYEGYLSKIRKDGELKKLYFKLLYHD
ncbi:MAG: tRNA (adenosine(37)-N6)-threonylcarbamoyltransferase complex ATPase subunit type 1 TsaE, partial [Bacilli bacterium]|nr:tRNA (adenosine(37)-N6)-threonylcarbamoyltransferase complex ATPase subunit type 1 TsaE [Bacilli bacterium]